MSPAHQTDPNTYDLIVIGGGAAGFFSAIQTAEACYGSAKILLLEKSSQTLGKVKISGGGRCNVTHACFDPKELTKHYPRGEKTLIGPFHHFQATDMVSWLEERGVELKTENDGRMFPTSDSSETIIHCLTKAATELGVEVQTSQEIKTIAPHSSDEAKFILTNKTGDVFYANQIMIATGGTRLKSSATLPHSLGHQLLPPVPSLFTFNIKDERLEGIAGVSVKQVKSSIPNTKLIEHGPILITHWGLSGPAILKLSAWGARELSHCDYHFDLIIDWLPNLDFANILTTYRAAHGKRMVCKHSPAEELPRRLWEKLVFASNISHELTWAQITKSQTDALIRQVHQCTFQTSGKSINKDEFVTCGGIPLSEINPKTFESSIAEDIYFSGEILDIDGITGGFNFQNAWTTAHLASQAIANKIM